ncbi:redoxin domain-containing protein [Prolixibacteraceae bacterium Z1-6]|uniref:Redoxin domain-containing protein n=1 Tax=Draconibacterium aestuarii TaxID=2998507 RepID=A0A9X3F586_9BACT|nr:redoxin domain-containing protein [Prolixibacteraceae bacterium Z1-6]
MKKLVFVLSVLLSVAVYGSDNNKKLETGDKAVLTDVKMTCVSGESVSLREAKKENGLLVLFSCNQCPFVLRWEGRYNDIKAWADNNDVGMIVLNSNYQKRDGDDSFEAMKAKAKVMGYKFNYVVDKESQIANEFGGQTTPHAFLFDADFRLVYKGAIDDSYKSANEVKEAYLKDAIKSLGTGQKVAVAETKPVGCGIKRKID